MFLKGSKYALSAFLIYILWYKEAYGNNLIMLYGTIVVATVFILADLILQNKRLIINKFITMLLVYGAYALCTGIFVCRDRELFLSMMVTYFAFVFACLECCYVCYQDGSVKWLLKVIGIAATLCALQTIFLGQDYRTEVIVTTMSKSNNPNTLGMTMLLGIFARVSYEEHMKGNITWNFVLVAAYVYVILISGSRKCLLCAAILVFMWMYTLLKSEKRFTKRKLIILLAIFSAVGMGIYYVVTQYVNTNAFQRILMLFKENGATDTRWQLYKDAFSFWKTNPFFGIGFAQYQVWSRYRYYSHSSYAEILSCTGLIGFAIFFSPLIELLIQYIKRLSQKSVAMRYDLSACLLMLVIELIMGVGQIYTYSIAHLIILSVLYMRYQELTKESHTGDAVVAAKQHNFR